MLTIMGTKLYVIKMNHILILTYILVPIRYLYPVFFFVDIYDLLIILCFAGLTNKIIIDVG